MSKNRKNIDEELDQVDMMRKIAMFQRGEITFEEAFGNHSESSENESSGTIFDEIEEVIGVGFGKPEHEFEYASNGHNSLISEEEPDNKLLPEYSDEPKYYSSDVGSTVFGISINYNYDIKKMTVHDELTAFSVDINKSNTIETTVDNPDMLDASYIGDAMTTLYHYMITCCHPFAILTNKEYERLFNKYSNIDCRKFIIFTIDYFKLLYYISDDSFDVLRSIPETYNMTSLEALRFYIAMVLAASDENNLFDITSSDYVNTVKNIRSSHIDEYISMIESDPMTQITDNPKESIVNRLDIDYDFISKEANEILHDLLSNDDEDEEDNDDEEIEESYDESSNDDIKTYSDGEAPTIEVSVDDDGADFNNENFNRLTSEEVSNMKFTPMRRPK